MSDFEDRKRDWFLSESVYKEQVDYWPSSNYFDPEIIRDINDVQCEVTHRQRLSSSRTHRILEYMILQYSSGGEIGFIRSLCEEVFFEFQRHKETFPEWVMFYWERDAYKYLMWLLGLAYLFDFCEYIPKIATWYSHNTEGDDDPLVCDLFRSLGLSKFNCPQEELVFDKPYALLLNAVRLAENGQREEAQKCLESYLKAWYKGLKDCYWHDRHKGKFATHFGYWSFEAGMVTLLFDLDDGIYRDMLYYPKDLVDYARKHRKALVNSAAVPEGKLRALPGERCPKTGEWCAEHLGHKTLVLNEGDLMPGPEVGMTGLVVWYFKEGL